MGIDEDKDAEEGWRVQEYCRKVKIFVDELPGVGGFSPWRFWLRPKSKQKPAEPIDT